MSDGFLFALPSGDTVVVGTWDPPGPRPAVAVIHVTRSRAVAARWTRALAAGELPALPVRDPRAAPAGEHPGPSSWTA